MKKRNIIIKVLLSIIGVCVGLFAVFYFYIDVLYIKQMREYQLEKVSVQGNHNQYVPQGLAYDSLHDVVLQTSYHKKNDVSTLYVSDFKTGKLLNTLSLYNSSNHEINGHVGGIATNSSKVWITSDSMIWEFSLEDILYHKERVNSISEEELPIRGDFCTYYDGELWIGDFYQPIFWKVKDNNPLVLTYTVSDDIDYDKPNKISSLPGTVQGMVLTDESIYFTYSYTFLNPSKLSIYSNFYKDGYTDEVIDFNGSKIPYYHFDSKHLSHSVYLPPMAEGFFEKDNRLYFLFESSSDAYPIAHPRVKQLISHSTQY